MKITNAEGKGGELISSVLGKIHTGFGNYLEDRQQTSTVSDQGEGVLARASHSLYAFSRPDSHGKTRFEGLAPAHHLTSVGFPYRAESHLPDLKQTGSLHRAPHTRALLHSTLISLGISCQRLCPAGLRTLSALLPTWLWRPFLTGH